MSAGCCRMRVAAFSVSLPGGDAVICSTSRWCSCTLGGGVQGFVSVSGTFMQRTEIFWSMLSFVIILRWGMYAIKRCAGLEEVERDWAVTRGDNPCVNAAGVPNVARMSII